jgi:hypothetical protein
LEFEGKGESDIPSVVNPRWLQSDGGITLEYLLFIYCVLVLKIDLCMAYKRDKGMKGNKEKRHG